MAVANESFAHLSIAPALSGSTKNAPLIGIPMDFVDIKDLSGDYTYSPYPWYALGKRYCDAVVCAGGVPVMLSYNASNIERYKDLLDGLLVTGTAFDVDPAFYGDHFRHKTTISRPYRTQFEWALIHRMLESNKPVLGISGGMQLLNVIAGGTLFQHLLEEVPNSLNHSQHRAMTSPQHLVEIARGSTLEKLIIQNQEPLATVAGASMPSREAFKVLTNSYHHQGVKDLGDGFVVAARTEDGVVEAIESTTYRFCMGVQWNTEFCLSALDQYLFRAFIQACQKTS